MKCCSCEMDQRMSRWLLRCPMKWRERITAQLNERGNEAMNQGISESVSEFNDSMKQYKETNQWINGSTTQWVSSATSQWNHESQSTEWVNEPTIQRISESLNQGTNELMSQRVEKSNKSMNHRWFSHSANQCINESTNHWTGSSQWSNESVDQRINGSTIQWFKE